MKKIYFFALAFLFSNFSAKAQAVNLEIEIIEVNRTNYPDCGLCGQADPTWKISAVLNATPGTDNACIHIPDNNTLTTPVSVLLSNRINVNASTFTLGLEGFEKNCNNATCTYTTYNFFTCFPSVYGDAQQCVNPNVASVNFRTFPPCVWHTQSSTTCGDYGFTYRFRWSFNEPPGIAVQPFPSDNILCPTDNVNLSVLPTVDANGWQTGANYQWQESDVTDCANASPSSWTNVGGATAPNFTPPNTPGTKLYRVLVTANCTGNFSSNTTISNCVRVTYNPLGVPGDLPPAVQSGICGSVVLPGSSHPLAVLLPPAVGAVNGVTYQWTATGGSFDNTTNTNVVWTAPTTPGNYTITLQYQDLCPDPDATTTCVVDVGSPDCDFAYVATTGLDDIFSGGPDNPYQTLVYAMSQLNGRKYIRMAGGAYNETDVINLEDDLVIEGGYRIQAGIWTKISSQTTTITFSGFHDNSVTGSNDVEHRVGFYSNGKNRWTLQDLTFSTTGVTGVTPSNRGRSNYAVLIQNSSDYNIIRCDITSGIASNGTDGATPAAGGGATGGIGAGGGGTGQNGSGDPTGGASGIDGQASPFDPLIHPPYINPVGDDGTGGVGGAASDNCAGGPGCGFFGPDDSGCDGNNGAGGANGANGRSWDPNDRPLAPIASVPFYVPAAQAGSGQNGGGGGEGAGGNGSRGGQSPPLCIDCDGRNGGNGGGGGVGGVGGTGGFGGGGSFAIYRHNSNTGVTIQNVQLSIPGAVATGGTGAAGSAGIGGAGGSAGACNGCILPGQRCSGNGGTGGSGGSGGRGRDGANGENAHMVADGVASNPSTSIPSFPIVSIAYNNAKACINSEIALTKDGPNSWVLPIPFINDLSGSPAPLTTSSYSVGNEEVKVYSTIPGQIVNMQVGGAIFNGYLRIANDTRVLPQINVSPSNVTCINGLISLTTDTAWGTEVEYEWRIYQGTNVNSPSLSPSTLRNPSFNLAGLSAGLYTIRYRVREICCGWSIPVYDTLRILDVPTPFAVGGGGGYCAGDAGAVVTLNGSEPGVTYVLLANGAPADTVIGTGAPISFAPQQLPANYTVSASRFTDCDRMMYSAANIFINPLPQIFGVQGDGQICLSGANSSAVVSLSSSELGVSYQLMKTGNIPIGPAWPGTGSPLQFPSVSSTGVYYIEGVNNTTGCRAMMDDSAEIIPAREPLIFNTSGGGSSCVGAGSDIYLDSSEVGVNYQLYLGGIVPMGLSVAGTGAALTFNGATLSGSYIIKATSPDGCEADMNGAISVNLSPGLYISSSTQPISCYNTNNGSIDISVTGGTPPYTFQWSDSSSSEDLSGLGQGTYSVVVTDTNNCFSTDTFTFMSPDTLVLDFFKVDATCQVGGDGYIELIISGGTPPYRILWNDLTTDTALRNLDGGTYSVIVTDAYGCTQSQTFIVYGPQEPFYIATKFVSPTCHNGDNGWATVDVAGGVGPFEYFWSTSPSQTTATATGLESGAYIVTVTDGTGCYRTEVFNLTEPDPIVLTLSGNGTVKCLTSKDASLSVSATGGQPPYLYFFNNNWQSNDTFTNLGAGVYSVLARDANGCETVQLLNILSESQLSVDLTADKTTILSSEEVQLNAAVQTDTTLLGYDWTPANANFTFNNCSNVTLCPDPVATPDQNVRVVVAVTDARGCIAYDTLEIVVANERFVFIPTAFTPNEDGLNDFFELNILGADNLDINIWNRWGEKVFANSSQKNGISQSSANGGWDGKFRGQTVQFDTYTYQIDVTYFDQRKQMIAGTVTVMK